MILRLFYALLCSLLYWRKTKLLSKHMVSKWLWCDLNPGLPDSKVYANTGPTTAISVQLPDQVAAVFQLSSPWFGMQVSEAGFLVACGYIYRGSPGNPANLLRPHCIHLFNIYVLSTTTSSLIVPLRVFERGLLLRAHPKSILHPEIHPLGKEPTWGLPMGLCFQLLPAGDSSGPHWQTPQGPRGEREPG